MSDQNQNDTAPKHQPSRAFDAFAVRNDKDGKGHFHKVGAAFAHKDGKGYDIDMVATPSNGRLTLRTPQERLNETRSSGNKRTGVKDSQNRDDHDRA